MKISSFFPSFVYCAPLYRRPDSAFLGQLLEECDLFAESDEAGCAWSEENYIGGYTSYSSLDDMHKRSPTFGRLRKRIDTHVKEFVEWLEMDLKGRRLQMSTCWINIMPQFTHHGIHIHPLSVISGTVYLQFPEGATGLHFHDPRLEQMMASPPRRSDCREDNRRMIEVVPEVGDVVLFESWMRHEVLPNPVEEERISVSFNYDWV
jgi:uncharacterized protein (TIGR02466 family)